MLTKNTPNAVRIHHARIIDVNVAAYTVNVATEFTQKLLTDVSFNVPYTHPTNGEGIYFMPEVGSLCWLCEPSDGSMPFILAWTSSQDESDFSSRKQGLNPGDMYMGTRDGNCLWLRRGGVVQIGATGICQRIYMPVNNTINDFCENYNLHSLGGDLSWNIQRSENDTDGNRPALFSLAARQFADDQNPIATLEIGSHGSNDDTILSLSILASGQQGAAEQVSLKIDNAGNVSWVVQQDLSYTISGKFNLNVTGDYTVASQGNVSISGKQSAKLSSPGQTTVEGDGGITLNAPTTQVSQILTVNGGGKPFALAPPLITWLATHVHSIIAPVPGSSTSPPLVPPSPSIASLMASSSS
jgi:hypothetical protein